VHRWIIVAAVAFPMSGQACAQPLGYYDRPDTAYGAPRAYYLPPPIAFAPSWYIPPPAGLYDPRARYLPPPDRIEMSPEVVEVPPPRPRSCGQYRYWNGEYCADARYERPYVGLKW
jgi:hypothetical protein